MQSAAQSRDFAPSAVPAPDLSKGQLWTGRVLTALSILFFLLNAVGHLVVPAPVSQAFVRLGIPVSLSLGLGILQLVVTILYAVPRTSVFGAILLTGYFGGAVAIHLRAGSSLFETLFPVILGAIAWAGIYLRDGRLRTLIPLLR